MDDAPNLSALWMILNPKPFCPVYTPQGKYVVAGETNNLPASPMAIMLRSHQVGLSLQRSHSNILVNELLAFMWIVTLLMSPDIGGYARQDRALHFCLARGPALVWILFGS